MERVGNGEEGAVWKHTLNFDFLLFNKYSFQLISEPVSHTVMGSSPSFVNCAHSSCVSSIWQPVLVSEEEGVGETTLSNIFNLDTTVPISTTSCQYYILHPLRHWWWFNRTNIGHVRSD